MKTKRALGLAPEDNVAVALEDIETGDMVNVDFKGKSSGSVEAAEKIPFGFKLALRDIPKEGEVLKYGEIIGRAVCDIKTGAQVHVHNIQGVRV